MNMSTSSADAAARQESSDQFNWLRQVAFDNDLAPIASRIAITLTKYFNRKNGGWTFMRQNTVAAELGISVRTVNDTLNHMTARGHLLSDRRGVMKTNRYHLALKPTDSDTQKSAHHDTQDFAHQERVTRKFSRSDAQNSSKVIREKLRTNPLKEPIEKEPIERESITSDVVEVDSGRRQGDDQSSTEPDVEVLFDQFYKQYPKHEDRKDALKAYRAVIKKKLATPEELLAAAMRYAASQAGNDRKFIKNPATWLNKGSWENLPTIPATGITIDGSGNPVSTPPPQQRSHQFHRMSTTERMMARMGGRNV